MSDVDDFEGSLLNLPSGEEVFWKQTEQDNERIVKLLSWPDLKVEYAEIRRHPSKLNNELCEWALAGADFRQANSYEEARDLIETILNIARLP